MRHPDQVLSREQILNAVWGFDFDPGTKVLEVYVGYLRRKLGDAPAGPIRSRPYATSATGSACPVARTLLPGGLRAQLAAAIALVTALGVGLSFLALYSGTGLGSAHRSTPA